MNRSTKKSNVAEKPAPPCDYTIPSKDWEDVPVACTVSGALYLIEKVVIGGPEKAQEYRRDALKYGFGWHFHGMPCASCRTTPSTSSAIDQEKQSVCQYRVLRGPIFVPRQPGS